MVFQLKQKKLLCSAMLNQNTHCIICFVAVVKVCFSSTKVAKPNLSACTKDLIRKFFDQFYVLHSSNFHIIPTGM